MYIAISCFSVVMWVRSLPYNLVLKVFFPKYFIKNDLYICSNVPINMDVYASFDTK